MLRCPRKLGEFSSRAWGPFQGWAGHTDSCAGEPQGAFPMRSFPSWGGLPTAAAPPSSNQAANQAANQAGVIPGLALTPPSLTLGRGLHELSNPKGLLASQETRDRQWLIGHAGLGWSRERADIPNQALMR